jgi:hypothetical protein
MILVVKGKDKKKKNRKQLKQGFKKQNISFCAFVNLLANMS